MVVQVVGYCLLGLALVAWALIEYTRPRRDHDWAPTVRSRRDRGRHGLRLRRGLWRHAMVAFGFVAAMMAGSEASLAAALAVTGAGILATEVSGLAFGASYGTLLGLPLVLARPGDRAQPGRLPDPGRAGGGAARPARASCEPSSAGPTCSTSGPGSPARSTTCSPTPSARSASRSRRPARC